MFNDSSILYVLGILFALLVGVVIGRFMSGSTKDAKPAARSVKKASALDYDVIPMEGLKDE